MAENLATQAFRHVLANWMREEGAPRVEMVVGRRTHLLSRPSLNIMRAAGVASSAMDLRAKRQMEKQTDEIVARIAPGFGMGTPGVPVLGHKTAGLLGLAPGAFIPAPSSVLAKAR